MRVTLRLDDRILREVKRIAAGSGKSLGEGVEDFLRRRTARPSQGRVKLPTFKGRGLRTGIDLDGTAGLLERMEGDPS